MASLSSKQGPKMRSENNKPVQLYDPGYKAQNIKKQMHLGSPEAGQLKSHAPKKNRGSSFMSQTVPSGPNA